MVYQLPNDGKRGVTLWRVFAGSEPCQSLQVWRTTAAKFSLDGQVKRGMTFQVADVKKALGSVSKIVHHTNRVVFDPAGSYIESLDDGSVLPLREDNGVCVLDAWVAPARDSGQHLGFVCRGPGN